MSLRDIPMYVLVFLGFFFVFWYAEDFISRCSLRYANPANLELYGRSSEGEYTALPKRRILFFSLFSFNLMYLFLRMFFCRETVRRLKAF